MGGEKEGSVSLVHLMQWCSLKCMCALRAGTRASGAEPQRLISDLPPALSTTAAAPLASPPLELVTTDQYRTLRLCSASCPSSSQQKFSLLQLFLPCTSPKYGTFTIHLYLSFPAHTVAHVLLRFLPDSKNKPFLHSQAFHLSFLSQTDG